MNRHPCSKTNRWRRAVTDPVLFCREFLELEPHPGQAQWLANSQSDPYALHFEVSFSDVVQDNDGIGVMLQQYLSNAIIYLKYVVPGSGVTTTTTCNIEGIRYSASANQTLLTMFLSPSAMYAEFRLDSTAFGVLNQNRLGVNA